jgi:hypothetical protein
MSLTQQQQQQLDYLKDWVTSRVDELMPSGQTQTAPVGYLEKEIDNATHYLLRIIRVELAYLVGKQGSSTPVVDDGDSLIIPCPTDYLRFVRLKVQGWKRPTDQLLAPNSAVYQNQGNSFLAGDPNRPVAALVPYPQVASGQAIHCFPKAGGTLTDFVYIPRLPAYELPDDLQDPMVWMAASRVLTILRKGDLADRAMQNGINSIASLRVGLVGEDVPVAGQEQRR